MKMDTRAKKIFKKFPRDVKEYFQKLDKKCQKHGITLKVGGGKAFNLGGRCGGYFDDTNKILAVAIGIKNIGKIIALAEHEANHMRQWLNPRSIWHRKGIKNGHARFSYYLAGQRIYKAEQCMMATLAIEHDCERKTLRALRKWQKYVNLKQATKRANSYLLSHWHMLETKKWPTNTPYDQKILKHCPDSLVKNPRKVPESLKKAFRKYL
jgi:hypothetical protein